MGLIAMSTIAGMLVILGVIIVLLAMQLAGWVLISVRYSRTRGG